MEMTREVALASDLWKLRQKIAAHEVKRKALAEEAAVLEEQLKDELVAAGKKSTGHIVGVGVFSIKRQNYPGVSKARMATFIEYLRETGNGALVEEVVPAAALKAFCTGRLEELTEEFIESEEAALEWQAKLAIDSAATPTPGDLAKLVMQQYGVETFQALKLSHTQKGK